MNKQIHSEEELHEIFKDLQSDDPRININNGIIEMKPLYWNFGFIINFVIILLILLIFNPSEIDFDLSRIFLFFIIIPFTLYDIFIQLRFYNKIFINPHKRIINIVPDIVMSIFVKEKIIPYRKIKKIDYSTYGYRNLYKRYILTITLSDTKRIRLISTTNEEYAKKITEALLKLV